MVWPRTFFCAKIPIKSGPENALLGEAIASKRDPIAVRRQAQLNKCIYCSGSKMLAIPIAPIRMNKYTVAAVFVALASMDQNDVTNRKATVKRARLILTDPPLGASLFLK